MTTRRENILARLKTNLDAITGASVYRVKEQRRWLVGRFLQSS